MNKDLKYSGYSAVPTDYEAPDGSLALSLNLIHEDNAIKPIASPVPEFKLDLPSPKVFTHRFNDTTEYLVWSLEPGHANHLYLYSNSSLLPVLQLAQSDSIISMTSVGTIVAVSTSKHIYYLKYNPDSRSYSSLGYAPPRINMEFGLSCKFASAAHTKTGIAVSADVANKIPVEDLDSQVVQTINFNQNSYPSSPGGVYNVIYHYSGKQQLPDPPGFGLDSYLKGEKPYKEGETLNFEWIIDKSFNYTWLTLKIYAQRDGGEYIELATVKNRQTIVLAEDCGPLFFEVSYGVPTYMGDYEFSSRLIVYTGDSLAPDVSPDVEYTVEYNTDNFSALKSYINKFIVDKATSQNKFIYPFFIRYALRLYDGQYAWLSEPILMTPNSGFVPQVGYVGRKSDSADFFVSAYCASIKYRITDSIPDAWKELIAAVDIFISPPIWTYNQGEEFEQTRNLLSFDTDPRSLSADCSNSWLHDLTSDSKRILNVDTFVMPSRRSSDDITKDIESSSQFYKVASIEAEKIAISADFSPLTLEEGTLSSLVARESFDFSNLSLDYSDYCGAQVFSYNNRLVIAPESVGLPTPATLFDCNGRTRPVNAVSGDVSVSVWLKTTEGIKHVAANYSNVITPLAAPWFFYPDSRAFRAEFVIGAGANARSISIDLHPHDFLNGACAFCGDLAGMFPDDTSPAENPSKDFGNHVSTIGSVYYSQVANPFLFTAANSTSIPGAHIRGMSSAAKALSQGQFGQFPLYVFTTNGVWAMETSSTGGFTARQPITRDVCLSPDGITQLDSAVLFPSSRGLMLLSGSQTQCITDSINNEIPIDFSSLPHIGNIPELIAEADSCLHIAPFSEFIADCESLYDYSNQRIIVFNPHFPYAYVYSLKSKSWGAVCSNLCSGANSYPEALAVDHDGNLLNFSAANGKYQGGILISRPLKLDAPDLLKTVNTVIQRGVFRRGHIMSVLYGSRDLFNWHFVWSSKDHYLRGFRGTPYKYFRIALLCSLQSGESISGASILFSPRMTNNLR